MKEIRFIKEIKFNHNYKKLHNQHLAVLVNVSAVQGKHLIKKEGFVEYDTDGKYEIDENEKYLYLVFVGINMIPFSTIRKNNMENVEKYVGQEGGFFKVVVEEEIKEEEPLPNHWVPMEEQK